MPIGIEEDRVCDFRPDLKIPHTAVVASGLLYRAMRTRTRSDLACQDRAIDAVVMPLMRIRMRSSHICKAHHSLARVGTAVRRDEDCFRVSSRCARQVPSQIGRKVFVTFPSRLARLLPSFSLNPNHCSVAGYDALSGAHRSSSEV